MPLLTPHCSPPCDPPKVETDVVDWYKTSAKMAKSLADEYPLASACATKLREVKHHFIN